MFRTDKFVEDCLATEGEADRQKAIHELLEAAMAEPGELLNALGEPAEAGADKIYVSGDLTILNVVWAPLMTIMPHNHEMWATIGIYSGREDNVFWRRKKNRVEAAGARALATGDVDSLGRDIVHSVTNPIEKYTGAIHIYGGDFFSVPRQEWEAETLEQRPFDLEKNMRLFREADERFFGGGTTAVG